MVATGAGIPTAGKMRGGDSRTLVRRTSYCTVTRTTARLLNDPLVLCECTTML
jgi:hypothetical protein